MRSNQRLWSWLLLATVLLNVQGRDVGGFVQDARTTVARDVALPPAPDAGVQETLLAVYRTDADAALVAERLVDLDEGFQEWRYRHVKMVERTIGTKLGTGGSAGVEYLRTTLFQPVFPDLWEIRGRL